MASPIVVIYPSPMCRRYLTRESVTAVPAVPPPVTLRLFVEMLYFAARSIQSRMSLPSSLHGTPPTVCNCVCTVCVATPPLETGGRKEMRKESSRASHPKFGHDSIRGTTPSSPTQASLRFVGGTHTLPEPLQRYMCCCPCVVGESWRRGVRGGGGGRSLWALMGRQYL